MQVKEVDKLWQIKSETPPKQEIVEAVGDIFLARLLMDRGINNQRKLEDFLNPEKMEVTSPFVFCDMQKAVERVREAIDNNEKILVWGDFDADGVTSTALLVRTLVQLNANVDYYIPNRKNESHGLNSKALLKLISQKKVKLVITVDCGISNIDEIKLASSFKVDTIITDHHESKDELPCAVAIINPKSPGALKEDLTVYELENLNHLAGCAVAFKLAQALCDSYGMNEFAQELLPLVTLGTVADVVPILGENRHFVKIGLEQIGQGKHFGLKRLLESCGYNKDDVMTSDKIAFGLAPRINAAGRLCDAQVAYELLASDDKEVVENAVTKLNSYNKERQELCESTFEEALALLEEDEPNNGAVVLFNDNWHIGVIGIVASKIADIAHKPVFLMTRDEETPNKIRCSARSVPQVNLFEVINANADLFDAFGGHALAAGLSFDEIKTDIETVKMALNATVLEVLQGAKLTPVVDIDLKMGCEDLTLDFMNRLQMLEPFGEGNPNPLVCFEDAELMSIRTMGANNNHLKFSCADASAKSFDCVYWNRSELPYPLNASIDVAFYPQINVYNGVTTVQLNVQDVKSKQYPKLPDANPVKIYDHRKKHDILQQIADYIENTPSVIVLYAENKKIIEQLERYDIFKDKIVNRTFDKKVDQIMFFDYPTCEGEMQHILSQTCPDFVHLMNVTSSKLETAEFIKLLSGMLKFVHNKRNGEFSTLDIAKALNVSVYCVQLAINLFKESGMINVLEPTNDGFKIEFLRPIELTKIQSIKDFSLLDKAIKETNQYLQNLEQFDIDKLDTIINCK